MTYRTNYIFLGTVGLVFVHFVILLLTNLPESIGLAIVRRNVLRVPHDIYPGYSIKKFGLETGTGSHVYRLLPNEYSSYFTVLNSGLLMSTANLSTLVDHPVSLLVREDVPESNLSTTYTLQLYVLDSHAMLTFPAETMDGKVLENQPVGTQVRGLGLLRPSSDPDRLLKYEIVSGDGKGLFHVSKNETTGGIQLFTTAELDREEKKEYLLVVKAYDCVGVDSAMTKVKIQVENENDNSPVFEQAEYHWQVRNYTSYSPLNHFRIVGTVKAIDGDGDHVSYRLSSGSHPFVVVPQTGEILLVNPPEVAEYELEVEAHDRRSSVLSSNTPAKVFIKVVPEEVTGGNASLLPLSESSDEGMMVIVLEGDNEPEVGNELGEEEPVYQHRITKRRVTRAVRPTVRKEFLESEAQSEGRVVFELKKEVEFESFKIRDENPWVTVEPNGAVRVKKKWDYEELGQEKTIDFWVMITNPGTNSGKSGLVISVYPYTHNFKFQGLVSI